MNNLFIKNSLASVKLGGNNVWILLFIFFTVVSIIYRFSFGEEIRYSVFFDRDIYRAFNLWNEFQFSGAELSQGGRTPGGFFYYLLWLLTKVHHDPLYIHWIMVSMNIVGIVLLGVLGGRLFGPLAEDRQVPTNTSFTGIYDLCTTDLYEIVFSRFLRVVRDGMIIMCHSGYVDNTLCRVDSLTEQREVELQFLKSDRFIELIEQSKVQLGCFSDVCR